MTKGKAKAGQKRGAKAPGRQPKAAPRPAELVVPDGLRVEYVDLEQLTPRPDNAKRHDVGAIVESMRAFGYVDPIAIDERTYRIVRGHGRREALLAMKESGAEPPARVVVKAGRWYVPCVRGVKFKTDAEALGYSIADNRTTELGGWLDEALVVALKTLDTLEGTGFTDDDLEDLVRGLKVDDDPEPVAPAGRGPKLCRCPTCGNEHAKQKA